MLPWPLRAEFLYILKLNKKQVYASKKFLGVKKIQSNGPTIGNFKLDIKTVYDAPGTSDELIFGGGGIKEGKILSEKNLSNLIFVVKGGGLTVLGLVLRSGVVAFSSLATLSGEAIDLSINYQDFTPSFYELVMVWGM